MRILTIAAYYYPATIYGGPVQCIQSHNKAVAQLGHLVMTYTTNANGGDDLNIPICQPLQVDGLPVTYFPRWWFGREKKPFSLFYSPDMRRALQRLQPGDFDLILIHAAWGDPARLAAYAAQKNNIPYIYYTHGAFTPIALKYKSWKKQIYYQLIEKAVLQGANGIIVNNKLEKIKLKDLGIRSTIKSIAWGINLTSDTIHVIKHPKDLPPQIQTRPYILFIGRLHPIKGLDLLIDSFSKISAAFPEWMLVLAGPDENGYKKSLENIIKKNQLENRVFFTGLVKGEQKNVLFSHADLCVLPSYSESFGMSALEAMAYGKPIVITSTVGLSEYGVDAAGRIVPLDPQALAEALREMLRDEELRRHCGANALRLAQTEFTWEAVAQKSLDFYREVMG